MWTADLIYSADGFSVQLKDERVTFRVKRTEFPGLVHTLQLHLGMITFSEWQRNMVSAGFGGDHWDMVLADPDDDRYLILRFHRHCDRQAEYRITRKEARCLAEALEIPREGYPVLTQDLDDESGRDPIVW